jgi:hypothetical protein
MHSTHLNEHDANQGAQSSGEFLGMTGNSGWYLLGSGGATILMVIFLWGIFGVSLLLCLLVGVVLCALSVTYVFTLKNNKPEHYDTDFFESALVESGLLSFQFGPRARRPANPFAAAGSPLAPEVDAHEPAVRSHRASLGTARHSGANARPIGEMTGHKDTDQKKREQPVVARADYDRLQEKLTVTEDMLEEALAERGEEVA